MSCEEFGEARCSSIGSLWREQLYTLAEMFVSWPSVMLSFRVANDILYTACTALSLSRIHKRRNSRCKSSPLSPVGLSIDVESSRALFIRWKCGVLFMHDHDLDDLKSRDP